MFTTYDKELNDDPIPSATITRDTDTLLIFNRHGDPDDDQEKPDPPFATQSHNIFLKHSNRSGQPGGVTILEGNRSRRVISILNLILQE